MADDIGPGDVLQHIGTGRRCIVEEVVGGAQLLCIGCMRTETFGLHFVGVIRNEQPHCPNHWRKIGGSRADTIRQFSEDLNTKTPGKKVDA